MAAYDDKSLYDYLISLGVIDPKVLYQVFDQSKTSKTSFQGLLVSQGLISNQDLGKIISDISHLPLANLSQVFIPQEVLNTIPKELAEKYKCVVFDNQKGQYSLACADPGNPALKTELAGKIGSNIVFYIATDSDIENAIDKYSENIAKTFEDIVAKTVANAKGKPVNELPIEDIETAIIAYAYDNKASDVHLEPSPTDTIIRCRIDGVLHDIATISRTVYDQLLNRIKVQAKLRTDEHQAAQDGKIIFKTKEDLDIRISIIPTTQGEVLSMRLLSERARDFGLTDLGLTDENLQKITNAYKKPFGMILSVGPSGSGKTTTLYSIVKILNKRSVKIMTIEDPVEYEIPGVNQIQVNAKTNLTFAEGLRSIARQDPDIILVGEIRDEETAGIAVNSALTGHLVLSTLHANDAATTFPRLLDFKIEPYLVSSTVNIVIAQRLVRKICTACRYSESIDPSIFRSSFSEDEIISAFGQTNTADVYKGKGCPICFGTGYLGRIGIFEVLEINSEIRDAINKKEDSETIRQLAIASGMKTMNLDALQKVKEGITTIDEVIRTTKE